MKQLQKKEKYNVAIVGATGVVGRTFIKVLEEYNFPVDEVRLLASSRSKGKIMHCFNRDIEVRELAEKEFEGIDISLFSAGGDVSKEWCPIASKYSLVIDNSSAFRMDPNCPLVVPEVNPKDIRGYGIIANPNCTTIQSIIPVKALDDKFKVIRVNYTSYQAVSGAGMKGISDLINTRSGKEKEFFPYNISKTAIPHIDSFLDNGYTKEEMKMVNETRKILHRDDILVSATCVRIPVENSHAVSICLELEKPFTLDEVREVLSNYPGIVLKDDPKNLIYPVTDFSNGNDRVYVGRIRKDLSKDNGLLIYCVADNIRKGAASNAVQIAKYLIEEIL